MPAKLRVTQVKSTISHIERNRATVRALGLKRIGQTVEIPDNDATRGMVRQVRFLVTVEEISDGARAKGDSARGTATSPSEDRGDAPASHRSEDSQEKT
ncbi:MAG TPA: 50S ribosomal protein L30 [Candidatus Limnocylindrales bacterium]|jgi:large subunit ribosomal protein L30|nr:50S ribosomal protein L30 [Candidatus Limnocylindrales bacterium]